MLATGLADAPVLVDFVLVLLQREDATEVAAGLLISAFVPAGSVDSVPPEKNHRMGRGRQ